MPNESLTLFMLVTPIDFGIAKYAISSWARLVLSKYPDIKLVLYCNGLSEEQEIIINKKIKDRRGCAIEIKSNREYMASIKESIEIGKLYTTDQGNLEFRQGFYEACGEIWTRELVRLESPIVGIVDSDFEVLGNEFLVVMRKSLLADSSLGWFSTDYSPRQKVFETYASEWAYQTARHHTWCCLYRRKALEIYSNFTYYEDRTGDLPVKYDHSARLQEMLMENHDFKGAHLSSDYQNQFIHYGAFAKNRSLEGFLLWYYRLIIIGRHNGWGHIVRVPLAARIVRKACAFAFGLHHMERYQKERQRFLHEQ